MTPKQRKELETACRTVEHYARSIGKDVQILLTNDGAEVAPLSASGSSTGGTLYDALTDAMTAQDSD